MKASEKLFVLLEHVVKKAVRSEIRQLKKEIIAEIRKNPTPQPQMDSLTEQVDRVTNYKPKQKTRPTSNLSSILESTAPITAREPMSAGSMVDYDLPTQLGEANETNIPYEAETVELPTIIKGTDGQVIDAASEGTKKVMNAMFGKNYSELLTKSEEFAKSRRGG